MLKKATETQKCRVKFKKEKALYFCRYLSQYLCDYVHLFEFCQCQTVNIIDDIEKKQRKLNRKNNILQVSIDQKIPFQKILQKMPRKNIKR